METEGTGPAGCSGMYLPTGEENKDYGVHEQSGVPLGTKAVRQKHSQTGYTLCPSQVWLFLNRAVCLLRTRESLQSQLLS